MARYNAPKISILLFKSKKLAGGLHPIVLRYSFNGRSYISISEKGVHPKDWDFDFERFIEKKDGKEIKGAVDKNMDLDDQLTRADKIIRDMKRNDEPYSFEKFKQLFLNLGPTSSVGGYIKDRVQEIREEGRTGTANSYNDMYRSLKRFKSQIGKYQFHDIDYNFLKHYAANLRKHGCTTNGIGVYMRSLRACYNEWYRESNAFDMNQAFAKYKIKSVP